MASQIVVKKALGEGKEIEYTHTRKSHEDIASKVSNQYQFSKRYLPLSQCFMGGECAHRLNGQLDKSGQRIREPNRVTVSKGPMRAENNHFLSQSMAMASQSH
ncbi:hypothetical protein CIHG_01698 [Coccidioides immitis H538.4]|uniref:Uncharacterized protein n=3 Tax=Coccidioides immitis TaxID=5501 RepID=A0A0J8R7P5_COCIT|nr:hypothetical protein CIRG_06027 [Coccidioides immitis RMSCC 2394]KMU80450.1 hypothetical protein CISG_02301 [Coccidioides immitis RMSCC 3703]KMU83914.1 hypothetical protein CIHG_01698 [Coccidioides immitis H538.4]